MTMADENTLRSNVVCNLCTQIIPRTYERVLINSKKEFDVASEIQTLPFSFASPCKDICRACSQNLKKRRAILTTLNDIEPYFKHFASVPADMTPLTRSATKCDTKEHRAAEVKRIRKKETEEICP